jgi:hypothetical protein
VTAVYFVHTGIYLALPFNKKEIVVNEMTIKSGKWGWLILLTSFSTLVCCAIPIILVSFGMGAVVAALYSNLPFLSFVGIHKEWTFGITALILVFAAWALFHSGRSCPVDPVLAKACASAQKWNKRLFWISAFIWCVGFFTAYLLLPLMEWG